MNKLNKLILGGCIACVALASGCSSKSTTTEDQTKKARISNDSVVGDNTHDRSSLAERIVDGDYIDIASVDHELARIRQDLIIDRYLERLYDDAVSEQAVESHYRDNLSEYTNKEIELAHILLRIPTNASDEMIAAVNTSARDIHARLHAGENFAVVAQELSDDKISAEVGGVLGWVSELDMDKALMASALKLEAGEVSEPIKTSYGLHIVKALSDVRESRKPLTQVRARIVQKLRAEAKANAFEQLAMTEQ